LQSDQSTNYPFGVFKSADHELAFHVLSYGSEAIFNATSDVFNTGGKEIGLI